MPVVGAINATALAGGFELLLACDVVVASSEAKFGIPEVKRGLFAAGGGTTLGTRIPMAIALELALTGDPITAERALALGLVNEVVEPADVLPAAIALAERIAANAPLGPGGHEGAGAPVGVRSRRRCRTGCATGRASCSPARTPRRAPPRSWRSGRRTGPGCVRP